MTTARIKFQKKLIIDELIKVERFYKKSFLKGSTTNELPYRIDFTVEKMNNGIIFELVIDKRRKNIYNNVIHDYTIKSDVNLFYLSEQQKTILLKYIDTPSTLFKIRDKFENMVEHKLQLLLIFDFLDTYFGEPATFWLDEE